MKKRMLFVYNPNAGKARIKSKLSNILETLLKTDHELIVYPTNKKGDASEIALRYALAGECDMIVCSGGDGTLNEVVGALMSCDKKIPVGYIPSGTTNDFGHSLMIPKDMEKAAELIVEGNTLLCDVGCINDSFFTYTAAFGIFTDVSYDTPQNVKNVLGRTAYILSGVTKLHTVKSYHMRVEHDGEVIEDDFIYGMIANSDSVGGFKGITGKDVLLDDGYFEMVLVKTPKKILDLSNTINDLLHNELGSEHIHYARVSKATIIAEDEIPWTFDGEFGGNMREAHIEIKKRAMPYITNTDNHE